MPRTRADGSIAGVEVANKWPMAMSGSHQEDSDMACDLRVRWS
ncbi:MAG: hypothetical protein WB797_00215 [Nocardioides sp.]